MVTTLEQAHVPRGPGMSTLLRHDIVIAQVSTQHLKVDFTRIAA
jgi:hypothetical protein